MVHTRLGRVAGVYRLTTKIASDMFSSFRIFFRPLLRILGMSQPLHYDDEFPQDRNVQDWERTLLERYGSSEAQLNRMQKARLTRISRYKKRTHVEHEYLIAEVTDRADQTRYVRIERTISDPLLQDTDPEEESLSTLSNASSQSSLGLSSKLLAHDHVTACTGFPVTGPSVKCIEDLQLKEGAGLILLDLAIVATLVHGHSEHYRLFKRQCFWFSDMIIGVMVEAAISVDGVESYNPRQCNDHLEDAEVEIYEGGMFRSIKIYRRRQWMIENVHAKFNGAKSPILTSVCPDCLE